MLQNLSIITTTSMFTSLLKSQVPPAFPKTQTQIPCSNRKEHRQVCAYNGLHLPLYILRYATGSTTETQTKPDLSEISGSLKSSSRAAVTGKLLSKMAIRYLSCVTCLGKRQLHAQALGSVREVWVNVSNYVHYRRCACNTPISSSIKITTVASK